MSIQWTPVTLSESRPDPRGSLAAHWQCWLESNRRRQNERDELRALGLPA